MSDELRFEGRVVVVTGAGHGLGRTHAMMFGSRGAKVVVNDLGGGMHGGGKSSAAADKVVEEIKAKGGEAVANYDSVEQGDKIVEHALDVFGRVDVVINNAGILRDTSFHKMSEEDWDLIYRVHVLGGFKTSHAAYPHMRDQGYGRIVFTASAAGIYGNFGQTNYAMAKLGLVGLSNSLALEGKKRNIHVNAIAPIAGSRLTETVLPKELIVALRPELVSPLVAWLCHESCDETGGLFEVGGGLVTKLRWERTVGKSFKLSRPLTPELIRDDFRTIVDFGKSEHPSDITASMQPVLANLSTAKSRGGANELIDVDEALGYELEPSHSSYDERDLALYALGVGAGRDPLDVRDLQYVYEMHGEGFRALPTFGVVPALNTIIEMAKQGKQAPGLRYGFDRVLHGEQYTELLRPLPPRAKLTHKAKIKDIFDKGKHAVVVTAISTYDETGEALAYNEVTSFVRGAGGFGGERGPSAEVNLPPSREPDAVVEEKIPENQALLYRLSGDINPLHADPSFAKAFGFDKPILHGLCTFGFAGRHVVSEFAPDGDPRFFKSIKVRFADSVFPGETLRTEMWKEKDGRIVFLSKVKERGKVVISNAAVELYKEIPKEKTGQAKVQSQPTKAVVSHDAPPTSAVIFDAIGDHLASHPEIVQKVATVFAFKLSNPESEWTVDAKAAPGSVKRGIVEGADVSFELAEEDFVALTLGKAEPQKLYFGGKLKIRGNLMAAQKLQTVIDPKAAAEVLAKIQSATSTSANPTTQPPRAASQAREVSAQEANARRVFEALEARMTKTPWKGEVAAMIQFKVTSPEGAWIVDLRTGSVRAGTVSDAACTLTIDDADLLLLARGVESPEALYQKGKLRVDGDVLIAHRLDFMKRIL